MSPQNLPAGPPDTIGDAIQTPATNPAVGELEVVGADDGAPVHGAPEHAAPTVPLEAEPQPTSRPPETATVTRPDDESAPQTSEGPTRASQSPGAMVDNATPAEPGSQHQHLPMSPGLRLVAIFKLFQGVCLASLGTGLIILFTGTNEDWAAQKLAALQVDVTNPIAQHIFHGLDAMSPLKFRHVGLSAFVYSVVLIVEGVALLRRKTWAEYLTIGVTGSFVPLEVYEVTVHFHLTTLVVLAMNLAVVVFLAYDLKRRQRRHAEHPEVVYDD